MVNGQQDRPKKERADRILVARGLAASEQEAQALIMAGKVWEHQVRVDKPGHRLAWNAAVRVQTPATGYVSRGGVKLAAALDHFHISVKDRICLDVGASTGGFTDCLLQRGAALVLALDVGKGQLDWGLVQNPKVIRLEGINARYVRRDDLPTAPKVVTMDVSFISLNKIFPAVLEATKPVSDKGSVTFLALVKPQFEAARDEVGPGGIVTDPSIQRRVVDQVAETARLLGFRVVDRMESPLAGAQGNREFFLYLRSQGEG